MVDQGETPEVVPLIRIIGELDPHAAEALQLEICRLAKRYGVEVQGFRVEKVVDGGGDSEGEETAE